MARGQRKGKGTTKEGGRGTRRGSGDPPRVPSRPPRVRGGQPGTHQSPSRDRTPKSFVESSNAQYVPPTFGKGKGAYGVSETTSPWSSRRLRRLAESLGFDWFD